MKAGYIGGAAALLAAVTWQCAPHQDPPYDPLAFALASVGTMQNRDAPVPPQCYTKTDGTFNPCWVCHAGGQLPNTLTDFDLQEAYAFSEAALTNHFTNLFRDRRAEVAAVSDEEILRYVREDNYTALAPALRRDRRYQGFIPDLELATGFDDQGFARDGSGWRAIRYKPFPGAFWPTNGSTDDVFIRLPPVFRRDAQGRESRAVYRTNLALLEAAIAADPGRATSALVRLVDAADESAAAADLDGDGRIAGTVATIRGLPAHYVGAAAALKVRRYVYPEGTEFLHSVRYLDPDAPGLLARRMKELRYSRKVEELENGAILTAYDEEFDEKMNGVPPAFAGGPQAGFRNDWGWQLAGFIEDDQGRLRVQTEEEHYACMGCHSNLGVTVDQTFAFARKVPGADGWRLEDATGIPDVPQAGHAEPEILTYFRRVGGGDELRANTEVLERFFPGGVLDEAAVRRAAPGGDRDITYLVAPSRARALRLDKAYLLIVREQSYARGRDPVWLPAANVHRVIKNGSTGLSRSKRVYADGRLHLDWSQAQTTPRP